MGGAALGVGPVWVGWAALERAHVWVGYVGGAALEAWVGCMGGAALEEALALSGCVGGASLGEAAAGLAAPPVPPGQGVPWVEKEHCNTCQRDMNSLTFGGGAEQVAVPAWAAVGGAVLENAGSGWSCV